MVTVNLYDEHGKSINQVLYYNFEGYAQDAQRLKEEDKYNAIRSFKVELNPSGILFVLFKERPEQLDISKMDPHQLLRATPHVQAFGSLEQLERSRKSLWSRDEGPDKFHQGVVIAPESDPKMLGNEITRIVDVTGEMEGEDLNKAPKKLPKH